MQKIKLVPLKFILAKLVAFTTTGFFRFTSTFYSHSVWQAEQISVG